MLILQLVHSSEFTKLRYCSAIIPGSTGVTQLGRPSINLRFARFREIPDDCAQIVGDRLEWVTPVIYSFEHQLCIIALYWFIILSILSPWSKTELLIDCIRITKARTVMIINNMVLKWTKCFKKWHGLKQKLYNIFEKMEKNEKFQKNRKFWKFWKSKISTLDWN